VVALVGVSSPGYRSLANAYLSQCVKRDPRLPEIWMSTPEFDTTTNPWWIAYQLLDLDPEPDVIGFSVVCWNARIVYEVIRIIKAVRPSFFIVAGGPEVGPLAAKTLAEQPGIDAVVRGEGEFALPELLLSIVRGGDPSSVPGVSARVGDGVESGPKRTLIEDLDSVPSPYPAGADIPTDGSAFIETYRGCPHSCGYCYEGKGSTRIRSFSWERIAADIERVASVPGMRSFSFIDPVFNLTFDRLSRLSDLLAPWAARGIRLHTVEVDIERVDDAAAQLLARAGVVSVETGPQSVGALALIECRRTFDQSRFLSGVAACRRAGISVECDLIVGLPGDTVEDVLEGVRFVLSADPGRMQLSTLHVLPGTDLWHRSEELGLVFDQAPPHELISTPTIGFADLRRLEVLGNATASLYRARLTP
jgi:radical SAM superfamily enzyme YgiQ (UPF0313 family)